MYIDFNHTISLPRLFWTVIRLFGRLLFFISLCSYPFARAHTRHLTGRFNWHIFAYESVCVTPHSKSNECKEKSFYYSEIFHWFWTTFSIAQLWLWAAPYDHGAREQTGHYHWADFIKSTFFILSSSASCVCVSLREWTTICKLNPRKGHVKYTKRNFTYL